LRLIDDVSTPAVVLGCFRHGGVGIVRSLGRLGVPVYAIDADPMTPAFSSRYCHQSIVFDLHTTSADASLEFLRKLAARIGRRAVLIATSDIGALFIAKQAERLAEWFVFPKTDFGVVSAVCSKKEMYFLAKKWNVPTPETIFPQSKSEVESYASTALFPVILKPILSGPTALPMTLVASPSELLERYGSIPDPATANLMIQEYVPGGEEMTWTFNGYFDKDGKCDVAFTGRKLRNYPVYFGQASLGICVHNEWVLNNTIEFMTAIGYHGALDLGYRFDGRDDRYKVNDINPRVGAMFRLFVSAQGMDVVRALYQDMTGQAVVPARTVEGRKWIVEDCDWVSSIKYYREGKLTFRGWRQSLRGVQEMSYLAKDDMKPIAFAAYVALRDRIAGVRSRRRAKRALKMTGRSVA
jgi:predicted ATP-grasp superfamily ATP-dependent carboligase